jgi:hypothetical protein
MSDEEQSLITVPPDEAAVAGAGCSFVVVAENKNHINKKVSRMVPELFWSFSQ